MRQGYYKVRGPLLVLAGLLSVGAVGLTLPAAEPTAAERMRRDLTYLASDECEGRGVETEGLNKAAKYIARQFQQAGLKPGGKGDSYFQPFSVTGPGELEGGRLVLQGPEGQKINLKANKDFAVLGYSSSGKVTAPVVFVGYGATAPQIKYDDYQDVDVKGKIVVVLRHVPRWSDKHFEFDGDRQEQHAALTNKLANAQLNRAAAMVLVNDEDEVKDKGDKLIPFKDLAQGFSTHAIPALQIKRAAVEPLFASTPEKSLRALEEAIDKDLKPHSTALKGWTATVETNIRRKEIPVKNVVGVLPGSGPLAKEIVVVGAHYDHLGYGERGSLARNAEEKKLIHHGADDNASGTTAILELARRFESKKDQPGRTLVFMAFSAEEKGLLGSRHYCKQEPLFPLADIAAMVNLDMVGRLQTDARSGKEKLLVQGVGTAKEFEPLLAKLNKEYDFQMNKQASGNGPSDHDSFNRQDIPVLFFWTGVHKDYHRPSDTADKINVAGMLKITELTEDVIHYLRTSTPRPEFVKVASSSTGPRYTNIPRLGIRPAYDDDQKGLLLDGVSDNGPADKAGLKAGDRIIAIAERPVSNIETYMTAIAQHKRGEPLPITIQRGKEKLTLKVTPE